MNRKTVREHITASGGIEQAMRVPKGTLTPKMKRFAEQIALGSTGADAYRKAYSDKGSPTTVGNHASRLKSQDRIKAEIERIERANEVAALHSAAGLKSIVIATLAEIATSTEEKAQPECKRCALSVNWSASMRLGKRSAWSISRIAARSGYRSSISLKR